MPKYWNRRITFINSEWVYTDTYVRASNIFEVCSNLLERKEIREKIWKIVAIREPYEED